MNKISFIIKGMDCLNEVQILKKALGSMAGGEENLEFDILKGRLTLNLQNGKINPIEIQEKIATTGMKAIPEITTEQKQKKYSDLKSNFFKTNSQIIMSILSFIFAALGGIIQIYETGFLNLFFHNEFKKIFTLHTLSPELIFLYLVSVITGAWFIFPKAINAAKRMQPDMNLLMTVAVLGAIFIGELFEAAMVTFLFSLALLLESWSVRHARNEIESLLDLSPERALVYCPTCKTFDEKDISEVAVDSTILVRPGEKIPLDGIVVKGSTTVNQAPITGESNPVLKNSGDEVFAGTINNEGVIEFKSTKPASDTTLARIIHSVENAYTKKAISELWVEKFAKYYTPLMMLIALMVATIPPFFSDKAWIEWFYDSLVILVIACPCALVISTPVTIISGIASSARAGVLIKGGVFLEAPARLDVVAIDKTGTLTYGMPQVIDITALNQFTPEEILAKAAALEAHSEHPLAKAILHKAQQNHVHFRPAENHKSISGKGAEGYIENEFFWIGSHRFLEEKGIESPELHEQVDFLEKTGNSVVIIGNTRNTCGFISIADKVRENAPVAVKSLKESGIKKIVMLTGDNYGTAKAVAEKVGIDDFRAELLPEDKVNFIVSLKKTQGHVAMIGDGINDAPALAASNLGIAMGVAGSDTAIETSDIALMSDDLLKVSWLIKHSGRVLKIIKQNVLFAIIIKLIFLISAVTGIATLWMAIFADMGASLIVIFNSLRLLKKNNYKK